MAGYKSDWGKFYEEGGILIADRYTTSNAVHQCSKLPPEQWGHIPAVGSLTMNTTCWACLHRIR